MEVNGTLSWREVKDMPSPAELIASPYDPEARYSTKRAVEWIGSCTWAMRIMVTDLSRAIWVV